MSNQDFTEIRGPISRNQNATFLECQNGRFVRSRPDLTRFMIIYIYVFYAFLSKRYC